MRLVTNSAGEEGYNAESTMFVCNRWDMVPDKDKEAVKRDTCEKLSRFYTDLKRSQVHYMSMLEVVYISFKMNTYQPSLSHKGLYTQRTLYILSGKAVYSIYSDIDGFTHVPTRFCLHSRYS
jgi:hypothetical protein